MLWKRLFSWVCCKRILQSSDIRVHLNSCYVTLIVITLFRGLSGITGKASRSLLGIGKTAEECFISLNTNLIQEPFVVFLYCIVLVLFYLVLSQLEYLLQQQEKGLVESHVSASTLHKMDHPAASSYHIQRNQASMYGRAKWLSFNFLWAMWLFKLLLFSASR